MTLVFNAAASDPSDALVRDVTNTLPAASPVFVVGDNPLISLYVSDGDGGYDSDSGSATVIPWLGIGGPGAAPSGGTFRLGVSSATSGTLTSAKYYLISDFVAGDVFTNVGASANETGVIFTASGTTPTAWTNGSTLVEVTSAVDYNVTAAALQTALNATQAIGANGVTVTKPTAAAIYAVQWNTVGNKDALLASVVSTLTPDSSAVIATVQAGTSAVYERQIIRLVRTPAALQTTWAQITDGWQARLDCNTKGLFDILAGDEYASSKLELQLVDGSGNIRTVGQVECLIRNEVVDPAALVPTPLPSYYTAAQARALFSCFYRDSTSGSQVAGVTETTVATVDCPAMGADDEVQFSAVFTRDSGQVANSKLNIYHDGNLISVLFIGGEPTTIIPMTPLFSNRNATNAQVGGANASGTLLTGTVQTSVATELVFKIQNQDASDDCRLESLSCKLNLAP